METSTYTSSRDGTPTQDDVVLVPHLIQQQPEGELDCDRSPATRTDKTAHVDNNNDQLKGSLGSIKALRAIPDPPATLSSESIETSQRLLPSTSLDAVELGITPDNNGLQNDKCNNNHTSQPESNIKLKRCKHGRIIIKDLSKKKLPTAAANESIRKVNKLLIKEAKDRPLSPIDVAIKRSAPKSPRRRRRSRSRSRSRARRDRFKTKGIIASRYTPSPPPTSSSKRRTSRSTSRSRGRSPHRHYDSPSPRRSNRSSSRRKRDRRYKKDDRRRSSRRSRNRSNYRRDSPRRSRSPRARRASGSLSPDDRGSFEKLRQDYRSPIRDHSRDRYDSDSRYDKTRRKDLLDEVQQTSRSLLEECKTSADSLDAGAADDYASKSQLLQETQKTASLDQPSKPPPPRQNHKTSTQSNTIPPQPPADFIRSSPPPPALTPPLKNTHSNDSSRETPSAPSPATPSNNSIGSEIYDPEGPIIPISPGDSPPLSPSLSDLDYPKPQAVYRPNGEEKNGDDDVPSSAVQLNHQEKYLQKLNRQERVIEEVKIALRPHYQNRSIDKEQYKDVLRRAVPKICHSKKGEINPIKIRALVEAYVGKMKRHRS